MSPKAIVPAPRYATRFLIAAVLLVYPLAAQLAAVGTAPDDAHVAKIKAAYLLNFVRFAQWPSHAFESGSSPIELCVLGRDSLGDVLDGTVQGQAVNGRRIAVSRFELANRILVEHNGLPDRIRRCHLLFISASEQPKLDRILHSLDGTSTLTVGETSAFAAGGAMLALNLEDDRIIFYANPDAIRAGQVSLSSKVLQLARIVGVAAPPEAD